MILNFKVKLSNLGYQHWNTDVSLKKVRMLMFVVVITGSYHGLALSVDNIAVRKVSSNFVTNLDDLQKITKV